MFHIASLYLKCHLYQQNNPHPQKRAHQKVNYKATQIQTLSALVQVLRKNLLCLGVPILPLSEAFSSYKFPSWPPVSKTFAFVFSNKCQSSTKSRASSVTIGNFLNVLCLLFCFRAIIGFWRRDLWGKWHNFSGDTRKPSADWQTAIWMVGELHLLFSTAPRYILPLIRKIFGPFHNSIFGRGLISFIHYNIFSVVKRGLKDWERLFRWKGNWRNFIFKWKVELPPIWILAHPVQHQEKRTSKSPRLQVDPSPTPRVKNIKKSSLR